MAILYRGRILWTGFPGAPGYTNLFFGGDGGITPGSLVGGLVDGFASDLAAYVPGNTTLECDSTVAVIDDATGEITDYDDSGTVTPHTGTTGTDYAAASGAVIEWITSTVVAGRILRGRTFVVPIKTSLYGTDGTLSSDTVSGLQTAATTVADGTPTLYVWHRPTSKGAADGSSAAVTSIRVPDFAAVLRSRRD